MRSAAITCLLTCLLFPGTIQVKVHQYKQVSVSEGSMAVLGCLVDDGDIQDFNINWFKQLPSAAPVFILSHGNDSNVHWSNASSGRYQPIRNNSHAHFLQVVSATVQDSALYWCLLTMNGSYPVWGDGTQLSVYGKDVQAPIVSLLTSQNSLEDSGYFYAACLASGFYPSVIEITWKFEGESLQGDIISGPFLEEEGDNVYTIINILEFTAQSRRNLSSISCEVRHDSSRTLINKDLNHCYRYTES